ncbi:molybdenum cofactor guanylyltransferase [Sphingomonas sp. R647]|uniref:molybdenum cofactor guanylyltransferase n=1 Tax=Sphingomonas sp. R647 TaxID=2875233 RepID=UPI001CD6AA5F|nr:molybdenum cofactor guanylyltransferase [Sphingomonas sp. R647]MCA1197276.1 molybdenum cofactor guanylyltransferase [Sphingomonas sp. R647]
MDSILGAILAGGKSRRFGSDKALATIDGIKLIDHVVAALTPQVDALIVCGRSWRDLRSLPDRPDPGLGPLAGLNAALHYALVHGHDGVLSAPVDIFPLPLDLRARLAGGSPRTLLRQHAIGYWPTALAPLLDRYLASGERSIRGWITSSGAEAEDDSALDLHNINSVSDLKPHWTSVKTP